MRPPLIQVAVLCRVAEALARFAHLVVERVVRVMIAVHRRLQRPNHASIEPPWLRNDHPAKAEMRALPDGECGVVVTHESALAGRTDTRLPPIALPRQCSQSEAERGRVYVASQVLAAEP